MPKQRLRWSAARGVYYVPIKDRTPKQKRRASKAEVAACSAGIGAAIARGDIASVKRSCGPRGVGSSRAHAQLADLRHHGYVRNPQPDIGELAMMLDNAAAQGDSKAADHIAKELAKAGHKKLAEAARHRSRAIRHRLAGRIHAAVLAEAKSELFLIDAVRNPDLGALVRRAKRGAKKAASKARSWVHAKTAPRKTAKTGAKQTSGKPRA